MSASKISPNYKGFVGTLGGVPTAGISGIPLSMPYNQGEQEYGKYYFVGKGGSDGQTGRSWEARVATIDQALTLSNADIATAWDEAPWAPNNTIIIAPGSYAENITTGIWGVNLIGLGDAFDINGERGVNIEPATGSPYDGTSVINSRIHNIAFESKDTSPCFEADNFNRNIVSDCVFHGNTGDTTTNAFEVVKDMTGSRFTNCVFHRADVGIYINTDNANSKQAPGNIIEYCYVTGCTSKGIYFDANTVPSFTIINHCIVGDGSTTLTLGLDDDTSQVGVFNTMFTATGNDPATADGGKYNNSYLNSVLLTNS